MTCLVSQGKKLCVQSVSRVYRCGGERRTEQMTKALLDPPLGREETRAGKQASAFFHSVMISELSVLNDR